MNVATKIASATDICPKCHIFSYFCSTEDGNVSQSVSSTLWSGLKYVNLMDCHEIGA